MSNPFISITSKTVVPDFWITGTGIDYPDVPVAVRASEIVAVCPVMYAVDPEEAPDDMSMPAYKEVGTRIMLRTGESIEMSQMVNSIIKVLTTPEKKKS